MYRAWRRWRVASARDGEMRRNGRIAHGACRARRGAKGWARWLANGSRLGGQLEIVERAISQWRRAALLASIARWSVRARFRRARRRAHVAMQEAARMRRVWDLRRGLRGWRAWWREKRVKHVAIETELRELLAGGKRWAQALIRPEVQTGEECDSEEDSVYI